MTIDRANLDRRNLAIFEAREAGAKFTDIAKEHSITPPRVREIYLECARRVQKGNPPVPDEAEYVERRERAMRENVEAKVQPLRRDLASVDAALDYNRRRINGATNRFGAEDLEVQRLQALGRQLTKRRSEIETKIGRIESAAQTTETRGSGK